MTIDMMMSTVTKEQIARLHPLTKRDLLAYFHNKLTIILGRADVIAEGYGLTDYKIGARAIAKTAKPLDEVEFRHERQFNMFTQECEGMCGV